MSARKLRFKLALFLCTISVWSASLQAYATKRSPSWSGEEIGSLVRQFKTAISDLKHEIHNHELEIRTFEEQLHNQDISFEHFRQQLSDDLHAQSELVRASTLHLESKTDTLEQSIQNLETLVKSLTSDLRQIKTQANDSVAALGQYKQKIAELENLLEAQNQHMRNLEAALHSMLEVWQTKEMASKERENPLRNYKVQPGDTLEKIARNQKVSLQALRDVNQLTHDRILVGQTLKLP